MISVSGDGGHEEDQRNIYDGYEEGEPGPEAEDGELEDEHPDLQSELDEIENGKTLEFPDDIPTPMTERADSFEYPPSPSSVLGPDAAPAYSPGDSASIPDDTPSVHSSILSTPGRSYAFDSRPSSRIGRNDSPQPFERRFHARKTSLQLAGLRSTSPAFLSPQSRQVSQSSHITLGFSDVASIASADIEQPWEVVRWTKLKKISGQTFSEQGRRVFGRPTYLAISASIAIGTSKGLILLFDYQQTLKAIIGQGTPATEAGSITSLAISADHTVIASGHASGSIFTWEIARPAKAFLHIDPMPPSDLRDRSTDGHVQDSPVIHVGFLGTRRTALVSADDSGMAFSHLASRGLGALGRTITTTRILGRYPDLKSRDGSRRWPSSVLAFSPLPLGNVEQSTDNMGLTAMLTPYLLVIVSTTPVARTQFKAPRSKDVKAHGAMTGCLAWFPAVRLNNSVPDKEAVSRSKLVWCWSDLLTLLEIHEHATGGNDSDDKMTLEFKICSRWQCDESITAVQWLSRSVLGVLTVSERLIILEDVSMSVADISDVVPKHIYHRDFFSRQLQPLVEKAELDDNHMHGVVPDAYHMSFKAYKGRLFLLGVSDVFMGTLSNWADRLVALMDAGRLIEAIELATSFYIGSSEKVTVALPENDDARHALVRDRLVAMINASLQYVSNADEADTLPKDLRTSMSELARPIFGACLTIENTGLLYDSVYESYSDASCQDAFLYTMEPYILDGQIDFVPPEILKDMINWYASHDLRARLEELLLSLRTESMDIDQITVLCKTHGLYDALIYIWNQALRDYVTPLIELCRLEVMSHTEDESSPKDTEAASRVFPYLAYTLTGRRYPDEAEMPNDRSRRAKSTIYEFLFSRTLTDWPPSSGRQIRFANDAATFEYPYLHHLMQYDCASFLSTLNETFEDAFLEQGGKLDTNDEQVSDQTLPNGSSITRQVIIRVLVEILNGTSLDQAQQVFISMFIARNVAKYHFHEHPLMLPGGARTQQRIMSVLCTHPDPEMAEECQLSVEYFLSFVQPADEAGLIAAVKAAGFYRVLRGLYKKQRNYLQWLQACFSDGDSPEAVFDCIAECFDSSIMLTKKQSMELKALIKKNAMDLATRGPHRTALCILKHTPDMLGEVFDELGEGSRQQYNFLQALLEPSEQGRSLRLPTGFSETYTETYIQLMCQHQPQHVTDFVSKIDSSNLRLDNILPALEQSGAVDAAINLLFENGRVETATGRLSKHLSALGTALRGLLDREGQGDVNMDEAVNDVLAEISKYIKLGFWLCQASAQSSSQTSSPRRGSKKTKQQPILSTNAPLTLAEQAWVGLLLKVVDLSRSVSNVTSESSHAVRASDTIRGIAQQSFTAVLAATAQPPSREVQANGRGTDDTTATEKARFLAILRNFLDRAAQASPSLADLRSVLSDIFTAYTFEESMLSLSNTFIDKDTFIEVEEAERQRRRGWRAKSVGCEGCRKRAWGNGAGEGVWLAWKRETERRRRKTHQQHETRAVQGSSAAAVDKAKGKGRATPVANGDESDDEGNDLVMPDPLVLFACTHLWHRGCLRKALNQNDDRKTWRCPVCD